MTRAFVIRPFNTKEDRSGKKIDFEAIHNKLIHPAIDACKLQGNTTGEIIEAGNIREDMFQLILEADLVICDITIHNANVFYELGIRHSLRKKRTIMIKGTGAGDSTIFDLQTDRYLPYRVEEPGAALQDLINTINATLSSERETDSPIFKLLPTLPEVDPAHVQFLPNEYREEVERAFASKSKGWLRLLSEEVRGQRFQWQGLKLVAYYQWKLKDYEAAQDSYKLVRDVYPNDVDANLALSNIYERLYRQTKKIVELTKSDQATDRVLTSKDVSHKDRVEALALKGRNKKTRWRREFEELEDHKERRKNAMNRLLLNSFQAYFDAFSNDLNHFWSGLAALQMGEIFLSLIQEEDYWLASFEDDDEAEAYKKQMDKNVDSLKFAVKASILQGLQSIEESDPERAWAEVSKADLSFLTDSNRYRILQQYKDAIPLETPFVWDAAKGQLKLFASLGIKEDIAQEVIATIDQRFASRKKSGQADQQDQPVKPKHLIVFTGHMIDEPERSEPRFPADQEAEARALIKAELEKILQDNHEYEYEGLASAAPGGDILFHEVCKELNIATKICLPMPSKIYAAEIFKDNELNGWRSRFLAMKDNHEILVLSDSPGLPNWLQSSGKNEWERGNQWVMKIAEASDAAKRTLVALWDEQGQGSRRGGTAHMVQLAQETGSIDIQIIDAKKLTNNQKNH